MGHKIRAQLGKTNVAGTGNYINQIGNGNQNNATVIHYYNRNQIINLMVG